MPVVAEVTALRAALTHLTLGESLRSGALACIPLFTSGPDDPDWLTLTEAGDSAVVTEVGQDGVVSALSVTNRTEQPLLLAAPSFRRAWRIAAIGRALTPRPRAPASSAAGPSPCRRAGL
jgi:hypothetical protein